MIQLEKNGRVGTIIINRPPANSYEINILTLLANTIEQANNDKDIKVVVIKSASEKFFVAGADIKIFGANDTATNKLMVDAARLVCQRITSSPKIFVVLLSGHALGGGLELAMACDIRLAAEGKYLLGLPEVNLGLMPGNGGAVRLVNLIGASKALELMLTGDPILPQKAYELGLINQLFTKESFEEETNKYIQKLASMPAMAMTAIKQYVYRSTGVSVQEGLDLETELVDPLYDSEDATEGYKAFVEKRTPNFK